MTLMPAGTQPFKADAVGRVRTPAGKRAEILRAFDSSGASGVEFARMIGVKYPTFAGWIRRRRMKGGARPERRPPRRAPVEFLEAVLPGAETLPVVVELPRGVRVQITTPGQIPLVLELLRSLASC